jgi:hypothetical protein
MKLEYKILWLDDDIEAFIEDEHIDEIEKYITNQGFDTTIDTKDKSEDIIFNIKFKIYIFCISFFRILNKVINQCRDF